MFGNSLVIWLSSRLNKSACMHESISIHTIWYNLFPPISHKAPYQRAVRASEKAPTDCNKHQSRIILPHLVQQRLERLQNILPQILHLLNPNTKSQQSLINSRIAHPAPLDQTLHATKTSRMMPQLEFTR